MDKLENFIFNMAQSKPLKLVVNGKFHVFLVPGKFGCCKYRDILKKYLDLKVTYVDVEPSPVYRVLKKLYVFSDELEKDLIDFENEWYDSHLNFMWKGENSYEF